MLYKFICWVGSNEGLGELNARERKKRERDDYCHRIVSELYGVIFKKQNKTKPAKTKLLRSLQRSEDHIMMDDREGKYLDAYYVP